MKRALFALLNAAMFVINTIIEIVLLIVLFPVILVGEFVMACLYFSKEKRL